MNSLKTRKRLLAALLLALVCVPGLHGQALPSQPAPATTEAGAAPSDSLADAGGLKVIKRDKNPRDQIKIGTSIMFFVIIVMVMSNNFNPD